ncbi:MAG TPA: hypothetical protein DC052_16140 [Pseudomonas sp.]|jgi:hypothetical protein|nr:hypothetical protein [Pseudomonas sp.]
MFAETLYDGLLENTSSLRFMKLTCFQLTSTPADAAIGANRDTKANATEVAIAVSAQSAIW